MNNIAVFIDLNKKGFSFASFQNLLQNLENKGEIIYIKLYNFSSTKNKDFLPIISKLDIETTSLSPELAKKRNRDILDIRQVVDVLEFVHGQTQINTLVGIFGEGNVVPVLKSIKMKNIKTISAFKLTDKANVNMVSENLILSIAQEEKSETPKNKVVKKRKPITKKKTTTTKKKSTTAKKKATTAKKKTPAKRKVVKIVLEKEDYMPTPKAAASAKKAIKKPTTVKKTVINKKAAEEVKQQEDLKEIKIQEKPSIEIVPKEFEVEEEIATETKVKEEPKENEEQFYISSLENFAKRTSSLNFEFNEDIEEKRQLLKDIDTFVKEQKEIQYNKEEFNPEIMTVLRELGNLAEDIRQTLDGDDDFEDEGDI